MKKQSGEGVYDWIANNVFGADLKDGEIHAPQYTKQGFKFGSYIGPGTHIKENIKKNRKTISKTDKTSKLHDIMYSMAKTPSDVRDADLRMIRNLDRIQKEKGDYKFNIYMGKLPIKAKMKLEDLGIIKKGTFSKMKGDKDKLLNDEKKKLIQEGYGKKKNRWMTHVAQVRKKNRDKTYKECLKLASISYKSTQR